MAIGEPNKYKVYHVDDTIPEPSGSDFEDYTAHFVKWKIKQKLNQLMTFEGEAYGIESNSERSDMSAGNYLYVTAGDSETALIGKFVIKAPEYESRGKTTIKGAQSTGTFIAKKNLLNTNTQRIQYTQETVNNILGSLTEPYGICVDSSGNEIINSGATGTGRVSIGFDYTNRIKAINKLCNNAQKEWIINHGVNIGSDPYDIDSITLEDRAGSSSSVKTFYLEGSQINAEIATGVAETENTANHIILKGTDNRGNQIETELYEASENYTELSQSLDGWLAEDIDASETSIEVTEDHGFSGLTNFFVKIDNEIIEVSSVSGNTLNVDSRGTLTSSMSDETLPANHEEGTDVILIDDGRGDAGFESVRVYLDDTSFLGGSENIKVGSETMRGYDIRSDHARIVRGDITGTGDSWDDVYAHSEGTISYSAVWSVDNPAPDDNSIETNGLNTKSTTDNSALNKDALDKTAYQMLTSKKAKIDRIAITILDPIDTWEDVGLGDRVSLEECDNINVTATSDTSPPTYYRVVEFEYSWPPGELKLYLNRDEVRGYSEGSYSFSKAFDEESKDKRQEPTRDTNKERDVASAIAGGLAGIKFGSGKIDNVVVPKDSWDTVNPANFLNNEEDHSAANVGFVKGYSGGSGPGGLWTESGDDLFPYADKHILPYSTTLYNLGSTSRAWNTVYAYSLESPTSTDLAIVSDQYIGLTPGSSHSINMGGEVNMNNNKITLLATPTNNYDAATKKYVDDSVGSGTLWSENTSNNYIFPTTSGRDVVPNGNASLGTSSQYWQNGYIDNLQDVNAIYSKNNQSLNIYADSDLGLTANDSGTLNGNLALNGYDVSLNPIGGKIYAYGTINVQNTIETTDSTDMSIQASGYLGLNAGSGLSINMANRVNMNNNKITFLATPTNDYDAATKKYVDDNSGGGGGGCCNLEDTLDIGNSAGSNNIDMNGNQISNTLAISGDTSSSLTIYTTSNEDIDIQADDDMYLTAYGSGIWMYNVDTIEFNDGRHEIDGGDNDDLEIIGDEGIRMGLNDTGGGIIVEDCSTLRPSNSDDGDIDLGKSYAEWEDVYCQDLNESSDRRLKKNINPINLGMSFVSGLNPVSFRFKGKKGKKDRLRFGLIAQDVHALGQDKNIKEEDIAFYTHDKDYDTWTISYTSIVPVLIKAVQDLQKQIDKLKNGE